MIMKRFIFLLALTTLYADTARPQQVYANDLAKYNMQGKVKSANSNDCSKYPRGFMMEFNKHGNLTATTSYELRISMPVRQEKFRYDKHGRLIEVQESKVGHAFTLNKRIVYDKQGHEIESILYPEDSSGQIYRTRTSYDSRGLKLASYTTMSRSKKSINDIYEGGVLVKRLYYGQDQSLERTEGVLFDSAGRLIRVSYYRQVDSEYSYRCYQYDNHGNKVKEEYYIDTLSKPWVRTYLYDEHNNPTCQYTPYDEPAKPHLRYEYDSQGNWIKRYSIDDGLCNEQCTIEYYK